jgi:hypothetical protein
LAPYRLYHPLVPQCVRDWKEGEITKEDVRGHDFRKKTVNMKVQRYIEAVSADDRPNPDHRSLKAAIRRFLTLYRGCFILKP